MPRDTSIVWSKLRGVLPLQRHPPDTLSLDLPVGLLCDQTLSPLAKWVYVVLKVLDDPQQKDIASLLGASVTGVQGAVRQLVAGGWGYVMSRCDSRQNRYVMWGASAKPLRPVTGERLWAKLRMKPTERQRAEANAAFFRSKVYHEYLREFCSKRR